jgi:glycosyltransferase involved in cell wall biosynthesis
MARVKVLFVPLGPPQLACSRVRVYQYLPFLRACGDTVRVLPLSGPPDPVALPGRVVGARRLAFRLAMLRRVLQIAALAPRYDLVFLQRVLLPVAAQRWIRRHARRLVFDFDDAIYTRHEGMPDGARWASRAAERFDAVTAAADAVVASTAHLAERARRRQPRTLIVPGPVDCERYRPAARSATDAVVVGWIGSPATTMYLESLQPVLGQVVEKHRGVCVEAVGAHPRAGRPPIEVRPWSLDTEVAALQRFDIGVMPLPDDEWTRGKAGYKLLQYMACAIPCVASPVGANRELVQHGETGWLADADGEWEAGLTRLIGDAGLRARLGRRGREFVEGEHSLQSWAPRFRAALAKIIHDPRR